MSEMKPVTDGSFVTDVLESPLPVLVDVWAPWCSPCKAMTPILEQLASDSADRWRVVSLNAADNPEATMSLKALSLPTYVVFRGGAEVARRTGAQTRAQLEELMAALEAVG